MNYQRTVPILFLILFLAMQVTNTLADSEPNKPAPSAESSEPDECEMIPEQDKFPEKMQSGVHEMSCRTVRWLDGLFGNTEDFDEGSVGGKLSLGVLWNEYEKGKGRARFKLRSDLPNFNRRWNAFIGRVDDEAYISDAETIQDSPFRDGISENDDPEWLVGLGYDDRRSSRKGWDYSIGLRLRTPVAPYVKARYRTEWELSPTARLKFRQTLFWRDGPGFGTTSHFNTINTLDENNVLRGELLGTVSEISKGTQWFAGHTWYHRFSEHRGISLLAFARGETNDQVPLHEYGFELTWRRQLAREWLFVNVGPTLTWPRLEPTEKREASVGFAVTIDFEFGAYRR